MLSSAYVLLQSVVHLAMGAEWESSGADAKTDVFRALVLSSVYVLLQSVVHLAMGAEWEPSGANAETDAGTVFCFLMCNLCLLSCAYSV